MKYSQHNEQELIQNYFPKGFKGGCIDVGASDGVGNSNTKSLEENGWHCLCIEPNREYFKQLQANRKHAVNYAVSNYDGNALFNVAVIEDNYYHADAISALQIDKRLLDKHTKAGYKVKIVPMWVDVRTLNNCIESFYQYPTLDFISIDTEGTELDVLKGFSLEKWNPKLLVIENNFEDKEVEIYLSKYNYKKDNRVGVNDFYVKK